MLKSKIWGVAAMVALVFSTAAIGQSATQVNITDPSATTRAAKVEIGNRLAVQEVPPANYYHAASVSITNECRGIAAPPANKALVVRQVRINAWSGSGAGDVLLFVGPCFDGGHLIGEINFAAVGGPYTVTFDPGVAVPAGANFAVFVGTAYSLNAYLDGYTVPSQVAPPIAGQTIEVHGKVSRPR